MVTLTVSRATGETLTYSFDERDRLIVGRARDANIRVDDEFLSLHHLLIEIDPPNVVVVPIQQGATLNGTTPIAPQQALGQNDFIQIGSTKITVQPESADIGHRATAPSADELSTLLGVAVAPTRNLRCQRCGARAPALARGDLWFCADCSRIMADAPVVPDGFTLVKKLGEGAMGVVYLATHADYGECALKFILPKVAITHTRMQKFLREGRTQLGLQHPRIVRAYDVIEPRPGIFCIAMEYVRGQSGDRMLEREPSGLAPRLAGSIVVQLLEALEYAHARGVVHRDIKEANFLVRESDSLEVLLADFGLAKSYETSGASGITSTGVVGGTLAYMPPEQISDFRGVRPAADVYAVGATLYRLLSGTWPHDFSEGVDPLVVVLGTEPIPLLVRRGDVPTALAEVVDRAMRPEASERYATATEMKVALEAALRSC